MRPEATLARSVFFLSGFAALLYQVIWQRVLVIFSGADVFSATVVVASFMAGLGAGSLVGGHLADRLGPRRSLWTFATAELCIGVFGSLSKLIYYDVLYHRFSYLAANPVLAAVVLFCALLVPTLVMGLSIPLLARGLTSSLATTPRTVGKLYGINTIGAAAGAFVATWVLIPRFGLEQSLSIAALTNVVCATLALQLARRQLAFEPERTGAASDPEPVIVTNEPRIPFAMWALTYGLTGFIALGLEIAWFRLLGVLVKSTSFTFGTLLAVYLFGLGAGAAIGAKVAEGSRRAGLTFIALQLGVILYAAVSTIGLVTALAAGHPIKLVRFLGAYDPVDVYNTLTRVGALWSDPSALSDGADFAILYLVLPAVLIGPATLMMGMSFPFLQKAVQMDFSRLGRRLGVLLATNIAGGVIGAVTVASLWLPRLGTAGTLRTLIGLGTLLVLPLVWGTVRGWRSAGAALLPVVATGAAVLVMPDNASLWARLHATTPALVMFDEDGAGLSLLKVNGSAPPAAEVYVNGLGQSWLPYGSIHTALGALPVFVHPSPSDVAIIGLGSGDTAFAAAGRREVERLVSIEILGAQRRTLERFGQWSGYPGVLSVLSDPRIEHRVGDGRAFILHSGRQYDLIEADALRPSSAYAGNLYSVEYFKLLLRRLKPGGYAVSWAPTRRIQATFRTVFPHVRAFGGDIYVGGNQPIQVDRDLVLTRAAANRGYYAAAGIDIVALLRPYLESMADFDEERQGLPSGGLNTDMFPRDEFALPF